MCELFAMSAAQPADVHLSLEEFSRHGGLAGPHKDGWGIAWYEGADVRLVKEPTAASDSACLEFIQDRPFRSTLVLSHIRKATQGALTLANTQPFARELGGRMHVFAHNGDLDGARLRAAHMGECAVIEGAFPAPLASEPQLETVFRERIEAQHGWRFDTAWPSGNEARR